MKEIIDKLEDLNKKVKVFNKKYKEDDLGLGIILNHTKKYGKFNKRVSFNLGVDKEDLVEICKEDETFKEELKEAYTKLEELEELGDLGKIGKEEEEEEEKEEELNKVNKGKEECERFTNKKKGKYSKGTSKGELIFFKDIR